MSIATALQHAQQKIAAAYTAVEGKGGTLPETQNLSNLADSIESISGGGGGTTLTAVNKTGATVTTGQKVWVNSKVANFTKTGKPTEETDGSFTGFGTSDYLTISGASDVAINDFEAVVHFNTGPCSHLYERLLTSTSSDYYLYIQINNELHTMSCGWQSSSSAWHEMIPMITLEANKDYWVKWVYSKATQTGISYVSTDGITWTQSNTNEMTGSYSIRKSMYIGRRDYNTDFVFSGTAYLKDWYVKVNNTLWWKPYTDLSTAQIVKYSSSNSLSDTAKAAETIANNATGTVKVV